MNRSTFPFRDFVRAKQSLVEAFVDGGETYAMLTGETGTGKTALLRELRSQLATDAARHRRRAPQAVEERAQGVTASRPRSRALHLTRRHPFRLCAVPGRWSPPGDSWSRHVALP